MLPLLVLSKTMFATFPSMLASPKRKQCKQIFLELCFMFYVLCFMFYVLYFIVNN